MPVHYKLGNLSTNISPRPASPTTAKAPSFARRSARPARLPVIGPVDDLDGSRGQWYDRTTPSATRTCRRTVLDG
jgi:hypothetical protein